MGIKFSIDLLLDFYLYLLFAAVGGGVIGAVVGRARTLGPRINEIETIGTFGMVALGACTFGLIATHVPTSLAPMVSGISTGIGFLAGTMIFRNSENLEGTTTAALVWTLASAGLAVGCGLLELALANVCYLAWLLWLHEQEYPDFRFLGIVRKRDVKIVEAEKNKTKGKKAR